MPEGDAGIDGPQPIVPPLPEADGKLGQVLKQYVLRLPTTVTTEVARHVMAQEAPDAETLLRALKSAGVAGEAAFLSAGSGASGTGSSGDGPAPDRA